MNRYITVLGDTWDMIAYKIWGNEMFMDKLINANLDFKEVFIFGANQELSVPEIAPEQSNDLPPWKRGGFDGV